MGAPQQHGPLRIHRPNRCWLTSSVFATPPTQQNLTGTVNSRRLQEIVWRYTLRFFAHVLWGANPDLLYGPSVEFPRCRICRSYRGRLPPQRRKIWPLGDMNPLRRVIQEWTKYALCTTSSVTTRRTTKISNLASLLQGRWWGLRRLGYCRDRQKQRHAPASFGGNGRFSHYSAVAKES